MRGRIRAAALPAAALVAAAGTCCAVLVVDPTTPGGMSPPCPVKAATGLVCPGCGAARMLYALLHADLVAAVAYNAVGVLALTLVAWSFVAWTTRRVTGRLLPRWEGLRWAPQVLGCALLAWFVVRNIPVEPFLSLRV